MVLATVLFGAAALRPSLTADLADERRAQLIAWTSELTMAGVNVPLALLACYLGWESFRFAWRWVDEIAVAATPEGLAPHGSLFMKPIPWREVADISFMMSGRAPSLLIGLRDGRERAIRGVDNEAGAADRFVEAARLRVANAAAAGLHSRGEPVARKGS